MTVKLVLIDYGGWNETIARKISRKVDFWDSLILKASFCAEQSFYYDNEEWATGTKRSFGCSNVGKTYGWNLDHQTLRTIERIDSKLYFFSTYRNRDSGIRKLASRGMARIRQNWKWSHQSDYWNRQPSLRCCLSATLQGMLCCSCSCRAVSQNSCLEWERSLCIMWKQMAASSYVRTASKHEVKVVSFCIICCDDSFLIFLPLFALVSSSFSTS